MPFGHSLKFTHLFKYFLAEKLGCKCLLMLHIG